MVTVSMQGDAELALGWFTQEVTEHAPLGPTEEMQGRGILTPTYLC